MKDQAMQMYHSKLETIGDRRMISLSLEVDSTDNWEIWEILFHTERHYREKPQQNMEVDDEDDEQFEDDQAFMEVSRRYKLKDAAGVSNPATTIVPHTPQNRPTSPDKRLGSTPDVRSPNKTRQSEMNSKKD
ncbi:unnamed protein product [Didymodactylos carnosus]|nr:unnamed protein product [Didymodactylos carnosus]CAF4063479.1 unnamed protein product [Didymodactylos carnosus]